MEDKAAETITCSPSLRRPQHLSAGTCTRGQLRTLSHGRLRLTRSRGNVDQLREAAALVGVEVVRLRQPLAELIVDLINASQVDHADQSITGCR